MGLYFCIYKHLKICYPFITEMYSLNSFLRRKADCLKTPWVCSTFKIMFLQVESHACCISREMGKLYFSPFKSMNSLLSDSNLIVFCYYILEFTYFQYFEDVKKVLLINHIVCWERSMVFYWCNDCLMQLWWSFLYELYSSRLFLSVFS